MERANNTNRTVTNYQLHITFDRFSYFVLIFSVNTSILNSLSSPVLASVEWGRLAGWPRLTSYAVPDAAGRGEGFRWVCCYIYKCSDLWSLHNFPQNWFTRPRVNNLGTWLLFGACTAFSGLSFSSEFINRLKASIPFSSGVVLVPAKFVMGGDGLGQHPWLIACPPSFFPASFCWLGGWAMALVRSFWYGMVWYV